MTVAALDWLTPWRLIAVLAFAAAAGVGIGYLAAGGSDGGGDATTADAALPVADVRIDMPPTWRPAHVRPSVPGFEVTGARVLDATYSRVVIATARAGGPSLLPAALLRRLRGAPPRPRTRTVRGMTGWSYNIAAPGRPRVEAEVVAIPTTQGVALVACTGPPDVLRGSDCVRALGALRLARGRALRPGVAAAFMTELPRAVRRLSVARRTGRARLDQATTPAGRAAAADAIAGAYASARASLTPLGGDTDAAGTLELLRRLGDDYAALGSAAGAQDAVAVASATTAIRADEGALARDLRRWRSRMAAEAPGS